MSVDPGIYCLQIVVDSSGSGFSGINVKADVALYPTRCKNFCSSMPTDVGFRLYWRSKTWQARQEFG